MREVAETFNVLLGFVRNVAAYLVSYQPTYPRPTRTTAVLDAIDTTFIREITETDPSMCGYLWKLQMAQYTNTDTDVFVLLDESALVA